MTTITGRLAYDFPKRYVYFTYDRKHSIVGLAGGISSILDSKVRSFDEAVFIPLYIRILIMLGYLNAYDISKRYSKYEKRYLLQLDDELIHHYPKHKTPYERHLKEVTTSYVMSIVNRKKEVAILGNW